MGSATVAGLGALPVLRRSLTALGLRPVARRMRDVAVGRWHRRAAAGLPIPPPTLIELVTGGRDVAGYVRTGRLAAESIRRALARHGVAMEGLRSILDFGCGCGRVIRYWRGLPAALHGVDMNPDLIGWCARHLGVGRFHVSPPSPPLPYPAGTFDLVYALSVFTHLDLGSQQAWLDELRRVTRPGCYVLLTTHGHCPIYTGRFPAAAQARLQAGECVVMGVGKGLMGSNAVNAYHPVSYARTWLGRDFTILSVLEGGAWGNGQQDVYLLQK